MVDAYRGSSWGGSFRPDRTRDLRAGGSARRTGDADPGDSGPPRARSARAETSASARRLSLVCVRACQEPGQPEAAERTTVLEEFVAAGTGASSGPSMRMRAPLLLP